MNSTSKRFEDIGKYIDKTILTASNFLEKIFSWQFLGIAIAVYAGICMLVNKYPEFFFNKNLRELEKRNAELEKIAQENDDEADELAIQNKELQQENQQLQQQVQQLREENQQLRQQQQQKRSHFLFF